ncbi:glycosyltransferase family 1 protein [Oscillatoria sp. FACHB-1407]|uniref:glycosyltransferase family protein n=1 Tax=Oscillatoria sp. FACHB-1407 TaxID=2692847 RepID=UPI00168528BD|nr:glycosyltransferase [Oscillatoria sp. FACHB-1407]MBD2459689.1 glycosyltransferase family 1 protein [Oscillatoria sp. FACHB-1407]
MYNISHASNTTLAGQSNSDAQILILSTRNYSNHVTNVSTYEFEDFICDIHPTRIIAPAQSPVLARRAYTLLNRLTHSAQLSSYLTPIPCVNTIDRNYDLFFVKLSSLYETLLIRFIKNWRQRCQKAICYIGESWADSWLKNYQFMLEPLKEFDHIFLGTRNSLEAVSAYTGRPCTYLPTGIDSLKFCPYPAYQPRSIDVCSLGRRSAVTHKALLSLAEQNKIFYYYDTAKNLHIMDAQEHRFMFANLLKRSRYFIVNIAKFDEIQTINRYQEISDRFFEGAAAGTVMLGTFPQTNEFKQYFDWQDVVIPMPLNAPNIETIITELDHQPERLNQIRQNNVINSLLQHDWLYRWKAISAIMNLPLTPGAISRENQLREMADLIQRQGTLEIYRD